MSSQVTFEKPAPENAGVETEMAPLLAWQVHLLRRYPQRLSILLLALLVGAGCVWMVFHQPLPVVAAVLLLLGSVREYLFPIEYRLTSEGIAAEGIGLRAWLAWKEARRCLCSRSAITITPLAVPSRLDAFRGVTLRFARKGQSGDRSSVLAVIAECAPGLLENEALNSEGSEW